MILNSTDFKKIVDLRRQLHQNPELSGNEKLTALTIKGFLRENTNLSVIDTTGNYGFLAICNPDSKGRTIMFRAETDALPIYETNKDLFWLSQNPGIAHLCGHDGHSAILCGLALALEKKNSLKSRIVLLFQPSEETGEGALSILGDTSFYSYKPDYIFALHNLPGFPLNSVIIREGPFAAASQGLAIKLKGITSHAAHPELAVNPVMAMIEIITILSSNTIGGYHLQDKTIITVVHTRLGERAFGITPGFAEVLATLRCFTEEDMAILASEVIEKVEQIAFKYGLDLEYEWSDIFPATHNDPEASLIVKQSSERLGLKIINPVNPFRWSEDFGHYLKKIPGALFCLGAGIAHRSLHHPGYDFPDRLLRTGINVFKGIIDEIEQAQG